MSFRKVGSEYRKLRLEIVRGQTSWRSGLLGITYFSPPKVTVRDLDADREPEIVLDTYTGGAHCCFESRIYRYLPTRAAYGGVRHSWADLGYKLRDLDRDGLPELVSADARFAYVFTSFAGSAFPIQLWRFDSGRLDDVTGAFPSRVTQDADALWRTYRRLRHKDDVRGVLAAWLADEYLLGREQAGWKALEAANRRGELIGTYPGWPAGSAYLRALRSFLVRTGYIHQEDVRAIR